VKFLLDQSTDARLMSVFARLNHDITRIGTHYPSGLPDDEVLRIARTEQRILITDDRDFGELAFRHRQPHVGDGCRSCSLTAQATLVAATPIHDGDADSWSRQPRGQRSTSWLGSGTIGQYDRPGTIPDPSPRLVA